MSFETHSSAPASIANSNIFSFDISFFSILIVPICLKLCDAEPWVPRDPPYFWKIVLKFDAVLFLLSVSVSIIIAVFSGPKPSYLMFSKFEFALISDFGNLYFLGWA